MKAIRILQTLLKIHNLVRRVIFQQASEVCGKSQDCKRCSINVFNVSATQSTILTLSEFLNHALSLKKIMFNLAIPCLHTKLLTECVAVD